MSAFRLLIALGRMVPGIRGVLAEVGVWDKVTNGRETLEGERSIGSRGDGSRTSGNGCCQRNSAAELVTRAGLELTGAMVEGKILRKSPGFLRFDMSLSRGYLLDLRSRTKQQVEGGRLEGDGL